MAGHSRAPPEKSIYTCIIKTPLGEIRAAARDKTLIGLWFLNQKYFPSGAGEWIAQPDYPVFTSLDAWLEDYFSGGNPEMNIPLSPAGTGFQEAVWKLLREIPYGKTTTYGALAKQLAAGGRKASAQAVGGAVGHNPISILIPCHRVLGADGSLTGYAGGLEKKQRLLELEGRIT